MAVPPKMSSEEAQLRFNVLGDEIVHADEIVIVARYLDTNVEFEQGIAKEFALAMVRGPPSADLVHRLHQLVIQAYVKVTNDPEDADTLLKELFREADDMRGTVLIVTVFTKTEAMSFMKNKPFKTYVAKLATSHPGRIPEGTLVATTQLHERGEDTVPRIKKDTKTHMLVVSDPAVDPTTALRHVSAFDSLSTQDETYVVAVQRDESIVKLTHMSEDEVMGQLSRRE